MTVFIGTSGWQYRHWRETFYPKGVPQGRWLEYYAERFDVVELNNSFYRLPSQEQFGAWAERTPDEFVFAVKMSRHLTHIKRLKEPEEPVQRFLRHANGLGRKLGPILIQLPPTLRADPQGLDSTLACFPAGLRIAVEFRHETWWTDDVRSILERYGAATCVADRLARAVTERWRTSSWGFVRFHQGTGRPHPCYKPSTLEGWADELAGAWDPTEDVFVFFNNDPSACALRDAIRFADMMRTRSFPVTSVASPRDVTIGGPETQAWATST